MLLSRFSGYPLRVVRHPFHRVAVLLSLSLFFPRHRPAYVAGTVDDLRPSVDRLTERGLPAKGAGNGTFLHSLPFLYGMSQSTGVVIKGQLGKPRLAEFHPLHLGVVHDGVAAEVHREGARATDNRPVTKLPDVPLESGVRR